MKNTCENCIEFDNEKHKNHFATRHAGVCKKWCEIMFLNDSCKSYLSKENPEIIEPLKPITNEKNFTQPQTALFFPI